MPKPEPLSLGAAGELFFTGPLANALVGYNLSQFPLVLNTFQLGRGRRAGYRRQGCSQGKA